MTVEPDDIALDIRALIAKLWQRKWRIAIVTLAALALTYGALMFVPRMYESSASLLVAARDNAFSRPTTEVLPTREIADDALIASQIELIQSRDTLLRVIDSENLREVAELTEEGGSPLDPLFALMGRKPSATSIESRIITAVRDNLTVMRERDSNVISIYFRARDRELAARVANALADAHVARRAALDVEDTAEATKWLEGEIESLRLKVAEAERKVAQYRIDNDLFAGSNQTSLIDQQLSALSTQISAAQERKSAAETRAKLIRELLKSGQPIESVPDVRESVVIQQLSEEKAKLQGERALKAATLLPNHPDMQALSAQIAEIEAQIVAEARRVASGLEASARIESDLETSLKDELTRLKLTAGQATKSSVSLAELEREAAAERGLLETYLARYREASARSDSATAASDVRVVTRAAPSNTPASPKTAFVLLAVGIVSVALQVGAVLFTELMAMRPSAAAPLDVETRRRPDADPYADDRAHAPVDRMPAAPYDNEDVPEPEAYAPREAYAPAHDLPPYDPPAPPQAGAGASAAAPVDRSLARLMADLAEARHQVLFVAGLDADRSAERLTEILAADALSRGLSVVRVDAGSHRTTAGPGLADLSLGRAQFGDIVQRGAMAGLAEVPWGQASRLDMASSRPATLVDALADLYELVIVEVGRLDEEWGLPLFAFTGGEMVVATAGTGPATESAAHVRRAAAALGFGNPRLVGVPGRRPAVA